MHDWLFRVDTIAASLYVIVISGFFDISSMVTCVHLCAQISQGVFSFLRALLGIVLSMKYLASCFQKGPLKKK